jgi:dimethylargininase
LPTYRHAIVRSVCDRFVDCIRPAGSTDTIDVDLARAQHAAYLDVLRGHGLDIVRVGADERYPDCCFVEDTAVVVGPLAVVCNMAAPTRRGEEAAVERELTRARPVRHVGWPATVDGGDVVCMGRRVLVGLGERTNAEAVLQLRALLGERYTVSPVEVSGVLHLKSACTPLDDRTLLVDPTRVDTHALAGFDLVEVPPEEGYAANCLALGGRVVVSSGYPGTRERVAAYGVEVVELDMSEFRKAGGSLTCLSILM